MANNYDEYEEYNEYEEKSSKKGSNDTFKKIGIALLIVTAIIIILLLLKGCKGGSGNNTTNLTKEDFNYETTLLEAGKKYFEQNPSEKPNSQGECVNVTLQTLISVGLVESNDFSKCNSINTYVRACLLENNNIQYVPWFTCDDKTSSNEYGESEEGTIKDVIADSSYIDFKFLPEALVSGESQLGKVEEVWKDDIEYVSYKTLSTTKYYRYRDKLYKWNITNKYYYTSTGEKSSASDVSEYYKSAPNAKYTNYDNKTTEAYRWYTTTSKKEYALSSSGAKAFSPKAIGDYTYNEGGVKKTGYQTRTITSSTKPTKYYSCSTSTTSPYVIFMTQPCNDTSNPKYNIIRDQFYSCADSSSNSDSVLGKKVSSSTSTCNVYSEWSSTTFTPCDTTKTDVCRSTTVTFYNWYKYVDSGTKNYIGTDVYYTSAPVSGAVKDASTKTTAYKWYRKESSTTSSYTAVSPKGYSDSTKTSDSKWGSWSKWQKSNPKTNDGRERQIESKVKVKLQEIKGTTSSNWESIGQEYLTETEVIQMFKNKGYNVSTLDDINNSGEIRYQVKMFIKNKKEVNL